MANETLRPLDPTRDIIVGGETVYDQAAGKDKRLTNADGRLMVREPKPRGELWKLAKAIVKQQGNALKK